MRSDPRSFDAFAADYDRFTELEPAVANDWLRRLDLRGGRALDAGCGAGRQSVTLAETYDEVVAIDISAPLIEIARSKRQRTNVRYEVADLRTFDDPDGFDLVFSSTALHHVDDLDAALANLARVTRPGGTVVCVDLFAPAWSRSIPRLVGKVGTLLLLAAGTMLDVPRDIARLGVRNALWLVRFRYGPWMRHLLTDHFLSWDRFLARYGEAFPGARFERFARGFAACIWTKP